MKVHVWFSEKAKKQYLYPEIDYCTGKERQMERLNTIQLDTNVRVEYTVIAKDYEYTDSYKWPDKVYLGVGDTETIEFGGYVK